MEGEYRFIREGEVTPQMFNDMSELLAESFLHNPMFGEYIFKGDRRKMLALMRLCLMYYIRYGIVYSLRDKNGKAAALSLWNAPGTKVLDISTLLFHGFFFATVRSLMIIGPGVLKKVLYATEINEKHHIKEPHYYLFMLSSVKKGAGRILLDRCHEEFKGNLLYWESSVPKDNHSYYKSFGAEMIGEEVIYGLSNAFFIWR